MKLNNKYKAVAFGSLMSIGMNFFMAIAMVIKNVGITSEFFRIFVSEWIFGTIIALLPSILLPPVIEKILRKIM